MRVNVFWVAFFLILTAHSYGQIDPNLWKSVNKVEDNKYIITIPDAWKKVTITEGTGVDYKFDFSGVGIPATVNSAPLYANFTIARIKGNNIQQASDQAVADFSGFYDRVTEPNYNYDTTTATIKSGETGKVIHTRYYRRSKVSNYSKFYYIIYNAKADETYLLNFNFQYKDAMYDIERTGRFKDYTAEIFSHFEFR
jgi:hypothetical protein